VSALSGPRTFGLTSPSMTRGQRRMTTRFAILGETKERATGGGKIAGPLLALRKESWCLIWAH
jgi:hypothetical protein